MSSDDRDDASSERWLVSYADFITLMFAFFAVLYATSEKNTEKTKEFQESVKKYLIRAGAFGESGPQLNQGAKNNTAIEQPIETFNRQKPETVKGLDQVEEFVAEHLSSSERKKFVSDVSVDDWGVRITLPSDALFDPGSEKFRADAVAFVSKLGGLLAKTDRRILVEGYVAPGEVGSYRSTWEFASARAINFTRFIQKKENLPNGRLATASLADGRPIYKGDKVKLNSRIEVILLNSDMEL